MTDSLGSDLEIRFPLPAEPWSVNAIPPTVKARIAQAEHKKAFRDAATIYARQQRIMPQPPSLVQVTIPFGTDRVRDPSNYTGSVVKAVVDGLKNAHVWPDDSPQYVTILDPLLVVDRRPIGCREIVVTITPRETK